MNTTTATEMTLDQHREALENLCFQNNGLVRILRNAQKYPAMFPAGKVDEFRAELDEVLAQARIHQDALDAARNEAIRVRNEAIRARNAQALRDSACKVCGLVHPGEC